MTLLPGSTTVPILTSVEANRVHDNYTEIVEQGSLTRPHEDVAPLQVLANIFSSPPSRRLNKSLIDPQRATQVFVSARGQHDPGLMTIQATVRDPQVLDTEDELSAHARRIG